jgi:hypothetical protein
MSAKKKIAAVVAVILTIALLVGGVFAYTDFSQDFINRFRGGNDNDILLHDDFEPGVNKDVYVENTGETEMIVRVKFTEYLQIGNTPIVGTDPNDKSTWELHLFGESSPATENCTLETHDYFTWVMSGGTKVYKPGTGEAGNDSFTVGQDFEDGAIAKNTLPANEPVSMAEYMANRETYDAEVNGRWILDTDGYAYWSKLLQPHTATNLLLDNVITAVKPDDNYYYAIDVILEGANKTEAYKLIDRGATDDGEDFINETVNPTPPPITEEPRVLTVKVAVDSVGKMMDWGEYGSVSGIRLNWNYDTETGHESNKAIADGEIVVDWGDGSVDYIPVTEGEYVSDAVINFYFPGDTGREAYINATSQEMTMVGVGPYHEYAKPGEYVITLYGSTLVEDWEFFYSPGHSGGFSAIAWQAVELYDPLEPGYYNYLSYATGAMVRLRSFPERFLVNYPSLTDVSYLFNTTWLLSANQTRFALETIPADFFSYSPLIRSFNDTFSRTSIKSLPAGLFDNNSAATSFSGTFAECYDLETVPSDLFANIPNSSSVSFYSTFYGDEKITHLPELWNTHNNAQTDGRTFNGCVGADNFLEAVAHGWAQMPGAEITSFNVSYSGAASGSVNVPLQQIAYETISLPVSVSERTITFDATVTGNWLSSVPGLTHWYGYYNQSAPTFAWEAWAEIANTDDTGITITIPANFEGEFFISACPYDSWSEYVYFTITVS